MEQLAALARAGHTVVVSVHQPRSSIFALLDGLLLLSEGRAVYEGPAADALSYFEELGHRCPPRCNPAEFLADLTSRNTSAPEAEAESVARVDRLVAAHSLTGEEGGIGDRGDEGSGCRTSCAAHDLCGGTLTWLCAGDESDESTEDASQVLVPSSTPAAPHGKAPFALQTQLLLKRSWRQSTRDRNTIKLRVFANVQSALVFGSIWWRLRRLQKSIPSRLGLLQARSP